jgi:hypothetical protein
MSYILDYNLEEPSRKWSVLVLSIDDRLHDKAMDTMHIQKVIRYFEYLRETHEVAYSDFKYGAVSDELQQNLDTLVESGLLDQEGDYYCLTLEGEEAVKEIRKTVDHDQLRLLNFAKQQLNDLPLDELMYFLYKLIPSTQKNSTEYPRLERRRNQLVCSLFRKGRINSTMAAKWLGISEIEFLDSLSS